MSWKKVTLQEIVTTIQTGPFGSQLHQSDYSNDGIPVIMPKDLIDGKISLTSISRVSEEHVSRLHRHKISEGDILYSRRGDVGRCAYVKKEESGWLCGTGCLRISINKEKVNSKFLFFYLQLPEVKIWLENNAIGSTMPNLNTKILGSVPLSIPPLYVQQKIAGILSAYDDLIENNQKQIQLLEEAAQRLYKEWFVDLRFPGHETTRIVDGVPEGWMIQQLDSIADIVMGQSPKSEFYNQTQDGLPFHQGVGSYGYRFPIDSIYTTSYPKIAKQNSILLSVRAPVGRLNVTEHKIAIGRGLSSINSKNEYQNFLFYMLKEYFFKDNIIGNGSIFASISKDELANQKFLIPCENLLSKFNIYARDIDKKIGILSRQLSLLQEARNSLLPRLMKK